ncbi:MAG TPA: hypothetical protein VFU55_11495 [Terracidiphilus sp.]|nr:hypothetical protein [Terracidiphilus sp.]
MRRALSILLVLLFAAGPFAAALQADDMRLPPCCRRRGAHHCSMSGAMIAHMVQLSHGKSVATQPAHCPFYPHNTLNTFGPAFRLAPFASPLPALRVLAHAPASYRAAALTARLRSHSGLSPPVSASL